MLLKAVIEPGDLCDVCHRVTTAEVAVATYRVRVICRVTLHQQRLLDIAVPNLRVTAIFLGQGYGVIDVAYALSLKPISEPTRRS